MSQMLFGSQGLPPPRCNKGAYPCALPISAQEWLALPSSASLLTLAAPRRTGLWSLLSTTSGYHTADGVFSPASFRAREAAATVLLEGHVPVRVQPHPRGSAGDPTRPPAEPRPPRSRRGHPSAPRPDLESLAPKPLFHRDPGRSVPIVTDHTLPSGMKRQLTPEDQQQEEVRQPRAQPKSQPPAQRHVEGNVRGSGSERRTGLVRMRPACLDPATRLQFP